MTYPVDPNSASTAPALWRMAEFLESMTYDMSAIASLVSDLTMMESVVLTADQMTQLQSIDRLNQALQDLALISASLAQEPGQAHSLGPGLQLAETRAILDPRHGNAAPTHVGMLDLF
ncbi:MAG: hypothetical protein AB3N09_05620 [Tateyamaria sp.]